MRILAEEAVEDLTDRFHYLGIPLGKAALRPVPLYWQNYIQAVQCGKLLDTDYTRFQKALVLADPFLNDSYIQEESLGMTTRPYGTLMRSPAFRYRPGFHLPALCKGWKKSLQPADFDFVNMS